MRDDVVNLAPYGARVWMAYHDYFGPTFYRSMGRIRPIEKPSRKTWAAYEEWQKGGRIGTQGAPLSRQ